MYDSSTRTEPNPAPAATSPAPSLVAALRAVRAEWARVAGDVDVSELTGPDAVEVMRIAGELERMAAGLRTVAAGRVAVTEAWRATGARSAKGCIARDGRCSMGDAERTLDTAAALATQPRVAARCRNGALSTAQARELAITIAADPSSEDRLLSIVDRLSIAELRAECARLRAAADPDPDTRRQRQHDERAMKSVRHADGSVSWTIHGTAIDAAYVTAVLEPLAQHLHAAALAAGETIPFTAHLYDAFMIRIAQGDFVDTHPDLHTQFHHDHPLPHTTPTDHEPGDRDGDDVRDGHDDGDRDGGGGDGDGGLVDHRGDPADPHAGPAERSDNDDDIDDAEASADDHHDHDHDDDAAEASVDDDQPSDQPGDDTLFGAPAAGDDRRAGRSGRSRRRVKKKRRRNRGSRTEIVARVDHTALVRGRVDGDDICDLSRHGPIPLSDLRSLFDDGFVAAVITRGAEPVTVAHRGRPRGARRYGTAGSHTKIIIRIRCEDLTAMGAPDEATVDVPGTGPLPRTAVAYLLADPLLARLVTHPHDMTVAYDIRLPNHYQRTAIEWRDTACTTEGCPNRANLDNDHTIEYATTHHTKVDETTPACKPCHFLRTHRGHRYGPVNPDTGKRPLHPPPDTS